MNKNKVFHHTKYLIFLSVLFLSMCSRDEDTPGLQEVESPPSITGEQVTDIRFVTLSETQAADLDIRTWQAEADTLTFFISVPGVVAAAPEHMAVVSTPVNGRITKIYAHEGEVVTQGVPLLELESLEFAELAANYLETQAEKEYLEQQVGRLTRLVDRNISPQSSLDRITADLVRADARVRAARARLLAVGIREEQMDLWSVSSEDESATLVMYAPIDGKINHHLIDLGQAVNANDMLLDIVDNRQVLVRGFVDPENISYLEPGRRVVVSQRSGRDSGQGEISLETTISTIQPGLDLENKSIIVNSMVNTQNQWPVIGQSVRVAYEARTPGAVISVPLSAIQFEGENATVFVKIDDLTYENRSVIPFRILQDTVIISGGLLPGEEVAVTQVFSLKALGKFEEFAED
jgi:RND family efflux transporter MFP subunit